MQPLGTKVYLLKRYSPSDSFCTFFFSESVIVFNWVLSFSEPVVFLFHLRNTANPDVFTTGYRCGGRLWWAIRAGIRIKVLSLGLIKPVSRHSVERSARSPSKLVSPRLLWIIINTAPLHGIKFALFVFVT